MRYLSRLATVILSYKATLAKSGVFPADGRKSSIIPTSLF